MKAKGVLVVLVLVSFLVSCHLPQQKAEEPLVFVVIPSDDENVARKQGAPAIDYLSRELGREIELFTVSDYAAVVEAMKYGHADIARLGPKGYVDAINEGVKIEPIARAIKRTGVAGYTALLLALKDTDVTDLSALTFAFVDVGSTSGYVAPAIHLERIGVEPKERLFAGSHSAAILALANGTVDIVATSSAQLAIAIRGGILKEDKLVIVWESELIPSSPIAVQADMSQGLKDKFTELLLDMPESLALGMDPDAIGFVETDDAVYDTIREILCYKNQ